MKSEMMTLAGEIVTLRTHISNGPNVDEALRVNCIQIAIKHQNTLVTVEGIRPAASFGPA